MRSFLPQSARTPREPSSPSVCRGVRVVLEHLEEAPAHAARTAKYGGRPEACSFRCPIAGMRPGVPCWPLQQFIFQTQVGVRRHQTDVPLQTGYRPRIHIDASGPCSRLGTTGNDSPSPRTCLIEIASFQCNRYGYFHAGRVNKRRQRAMGFHLRLHPPEYVNVVEILCTRWGSSRAPLPPASGLLPVSQISGGNCKTVRLRRDISAWSPAAPSTPFNHGSNAAGFNFESGNADRSGIS